MPASNSVRFIQALYESFNRGEIPAVLDALDNGIDWVPAENAPYAAVGPFHGREAVTSNVFQHIAAEWEKLTIAVNEYLDAGGSVIALGRYNGKHRHTGKTTDAQFAHIWDVRNGRVTRFRQYTDTLQLSEAAGHVKRDSVRAAR